jgi:hypothetical protein
MNYQLLHKFPMNYQLDQNRASNYHSYSFFPLLLVKRVKFNGQRVMCESRAFLMYFLPILPLSSSVLSLSLISFFHFSHAPHRLFYLEPHGLQLVFNTPHLAISPCGRPFSLPLKYTDEPFSFTSFCLPRTPFNSRVFFLFLQNPPFERKDR